MNIEIIKKYNKFVYYLIIVVLMWISITTTIQAFKCQKLTRTELFLNIPNSAILNWEKCDN